MILGISSGDLYMLIVGILSFVVFMQYYKSDTPIVEKPISGWIWVILIALIVAFRSYNDYGDTVVYVDIYENIHASGKPHDTARDAVFYYITNYLATSGYGLKAYFTVCSFLYFVPLFIALKKFFPDNSFAALITFLASLSAFSFATNGIRNGIAFVFFLCAIAYREKWLICAICLALSYGFHHAMHMCIAAFLMVAIFRKTNFYIALWFICLAMAAAHITFFQEIFSGFTDDQGKGYLQTNDMSSGYRTGFRLDFIIYGFAPILLGLLNRKRFSMGKDYRFTFNLYILLNSIWLLCMYASFTNRIAALSWLLLPVVIIYPYCTQDRPAVIVRNAGFSNVFLIQYMFTIFMTFIYYSIIKPML